MLRFHRQGSFKSGKKIVIFNLLGYYGGPLMLSVLCATLRKLGYDARLYMAQDFVVEKGNEKCFRRKVASLNIKMSFKRSVVKLFPFMSTLFPYKGGEMSSVSIPGLAFQVFPCFNRNTIMIYPEVIFGNPLFASNIVRWLLYHYKFEGVEGAYSIDDLFVAYREVFNSPTLNPQHRVLHMSYFDHNLYRQYNFTKRSGNCYIVRSSKVGNRTDIPASFDGPVFNDNMTQNEIVKMFNECEYCYSYDTQTFYMSIAAVCGCIPIVVMEPGKTERDYLAPGETHWGVAYGDSKEQIEYAKETRSLLIKSLDYAESNMENAKRFVEILESNYGKIRRLSNDFS